ncbi:hypothetical protein ACQP3F_30290, partial [Escherichia coli]
MYYHLEFFSNGADEIDGSEGEGIVSQVLELQMCTITPSLSLIKLLINLMSNFKCSLYIIENDPLLDKAFAHIFSPSVF